MNIKLVDVSPNQVELIAACRRDITVHVHQFSLFAFHLAAEKEDFRF